MKGASKNPCKKKAKVCDSVEHPYEEENEDEDDISLPAGGDEEDAPDEPDEPLPADEDLLVGPTRDDGEILRACSDESPTLNSHAMRLAIAYYYINVLDVPPVSEWGGHDGTISIIRMNLKVQNSRSRVGEILAQVHACHWSGTQYTGDRKTVGDLSRKVKIKKDSVEAQIIADGVEDGMSMSMAHALVNWHCAKSNQEPFSLSAVRTLILSLDPVVSPLVKTKQGDTDPTSPWSRCRYNWVLQLLIRFGLVCFGLQTNGEWAFQATAPTNSNITREPEVDRPPIVLDCFNKAKMTALSRHQIVWWDESHQVCKLATDGNAKKEQIRFKRDPTTGKLAKDGQLRDPHKELRVKYEKEVRLGLGCASTKNGDGLVEGKRCRAFDYSGKIILSIKDYKDKEKAEVIRVKSLKGSNFWVLDRRQKGEFWDVDKIIPGIIPGIGEKKL